MESISSAPLSMWLPVHDSFSLSLLPKDCVPRFFDMLYAMADNKGYIGSKVKRIPQNNERYADNFQTSRHWMTAIFPRIAPVKIINTIRRVPSLNLRIKKTVAVYLALLSMKALPTAFSFIGTNLPCVPQHQRRQPSSTTLADSSINNIIDALEELYPTAGLDQRIALSRKDGYWPYISKGEDPPQEFVYGEFDLTFFSEVLERAANYYQDKTSDSATSNFGAPSVSPSPWKDKVFTDIGSGTGRLVLTAAALHPWKLCRGIELLEGIHQGAVETLQKCMPDGKAFSEHSKTMSSSNNERLSMRNQVSSVPLAPIELKCGSFDDPYEFFGDSNLIFVFSTCMSKHILINLARAIGRQCLPGCLVLTTEYELPLRGNIDPLPDDPEYPSGEYALELIESITGTNEATGGESTVHIHRVTKALGSGKPSERPKLSASEICYRAIKDAEDPSKNDYNDFLRRVSNQLQSPYFGNF